MIQDYTNTTHSPATKWVSTSDFRQINTPKSLIQHLLKSNEGIVFGDPHNVPSVLYFMVEIMPVLKTCCVEQNFLEIFKSADQKILDHYNNIGNNENEVSQYLEYLRGAHIPVTKEMFFEIPRAANAQGINLFGLDKPWEGFKRIGSRNPHWTNVIREKTQQLSDNGRYTAFVGELHIHNPNLFAEEYSYDMAEGIDHILDIPSITFSINKYMPPEERKVTMGTIGLPQVDFVIILPEKMKIQNLTLEKSNTIRGM